MSLITDIHKHNSPHLVQTLYRGKLNGSGIFSSIVYIRLLIVRYKTVFYNIYVFLNLCITNDDGKVSTHKPAFTCRQSVQLCKTNTTLM
jgi:hypothetical protein